MLKIEMKMMSKDCKNSGPKCVCLNGSNYLFTDRDDLMPERKVPLFRGEYVIFFRIFSIFFRTLFS